MPSVLSTKLCLLLVLAGLAVGVGLGKSMAVTCTTSSGGFETIKPTNWDVNSGQGFSGAPSSPASR